MTIHAEYPTPKGDEMNAIDDLREAIRRENLGGISKTEIYEWLTECADRIEHEYMERPKDADGMPIEIGDTVGCEQRYTHVGGEDVVKATGKSVELVRSASGWTVYVDSWDDSFPSDCVKHVKPDSWEQIEDDACKNYMNYFCCSGFACADCPSKIDGVKPYSRYDTDSCELAMRKDIVRRAKVIAGVE